MPGATGAFDRDRLPTWPSYADSIGLTLHGRGKWRNAICDFHADTAPSLRVNTESNGWVCMSCRAKGGDVLSHYMQRTNTGFREAALALGAWDTTKEKHTERKPRSLSAADAMQVIAFDLLVLIVVISDLRRGLIPSDATWQQFLTRAGQVEALAMEFRA